MGGRGGKAGGGEGTGELLAICVRESQLTDVFRHNSVCNDYYSLLSLKDRGGSKIYE